MGQLFRMTANPAGILLLVLLSLPAVCVSQTAQSPAVREAMAAPTNMLSRLYFGRAIAGGGQVSEKEWTMFLAEVVTPRFPDGFTTWPVQGQWRDKSGTIVQEPAFVFEIVHGTDTRTVDGIKAIVTEYKRRFRQDAVLWMRNRVEISF
jgi:hypothetical protein